MKIIIIKFKYIHLQIGTGVSIERGKKLAEELGDFEIVKNENGSQIFKFYGLDMTELEENIDTILNHSKEWNIGNYKLNIYYNEKN